ncbi:MAG TPA: hypothetical protein VHN14_07840 [Kofleriaceae bacterium]|jgi:hypothetical protein|nr:hypothetical protein [Kofleriaceae bacterium]
MRKAVDQYNGVPLATIHASATAVPGTKSDLIRDDPEDLVGRSLINRSRI